MKVLLGVALWVGVVNSALGLPTAEEVYRSDRLDVVLFKDSEDARIFWYVPKIEVSHDIQKRLRADGRTEYTFYLIPRFSNQLVEYLVGEVPGLANRSQLKPVVARRFAISIRHFGVSSESEQVHDYRYINQPQLLRLTLDPEQVEDFELLYQARPGVPVQTAITYDSDRVQKFLQIELTYREVFNALSIGASGQYSFTRAEIENKVGDYLSQKYLNIRSKGDLQIPEVVNRVIEQCFTPTVRASQEVQQFLALSGAAPDANLAVAPDAAFFKSASRSRRSTPVPPPYGLELPVSPLPGRGSGPVPGAGEPPGNELTFSFKRELANRNEKFLFHQIHFEESQVTTVVSTYLSAQGQGTRNGETNVEVLPSRVAVVEHNRGSGRPLATGLRVSRGDQWTIQAVFSLAAQSLFLGNSRKTFRWESEWPSTAGDLYYRVGNGPWIAVNGRASVGGDVTQEGELSFYLDKTSIWNKIPKTFTEGDLGGLLPAIFSYPKTYPAFVVTMSGRRISVE